MPAIISLILLGCRYSFGQFWQCCHYIYINIPQIVLAQVKPFQCTDVCKCLKWHNLHCNMIYRDVSRNVNWWNCSQFVFEGENVLLKITFSNLVTLRTYLDGWTADRFLSNLYKLNQLTHRIHHFTSTQLCYSVSEDVLDGCFSQMFLGLFHLSPDTVLTDLSTLWDPFVLPTLFSWFYRSLL